MNADHVDGMRMGIGVAVQTIDELARREGDPTTQLARLADALRSASAGITADGVI